jgi:DNA-binding PadR family transcriptional regulator
MLTLPPQCIVAHAVHKAQAQTNTLDKENRFMYITLMNLTRLMILGLLAKNGPRHGHQIRHDVDVTNADIWGGVSVGALYRELPQMETEGLIEAVRTEQIGRRPARTIYQITQEGQNALRSQRHQALTELYLSPDAVGVALLFGGIDEAGDVPAFLQERKAAIRQELASVIAERERLVAAGLLAPLDVAVFRRREFLRQAELAWIEEVEQQLATSGVTNNPLPPTQQ